MTDLAASTSDTQARMQAVQPEHSIIVQAPAGSGKTTLLVERYLALLAVVEAPENILAITFTRKAAAEMRQRVLRFLDPEFVSEQPHEQAALKKARAIVDKVAQWRILDNPARLLIRTIDSFNHYLARTMPVASQLGPVPTPADNARSLYRQAARTVLSLLDSNDALVPHLQRLLAWRDHRSQDIEDLLAALLGRRDQWLRALRVADGAQREQLEAVLRSVVVQQLEQSASALTNTLSTHGISAQELLSTLQEAAAVLMAADRASNITAFLTATALPNANPDSLALWAGLAEAMLTTEGKFRVAARINKNTGFTPKSKHKESMQHILHAIDSEQHFRKHLHAARALPTPIYDDPDWAVLDSLLRVLLRSAGELELVFARSGQTDYTGLSAAALRGLGDGESDITDLGLYLDQRIAHILVDEFQDTNWSQLHLLENLTAGWEPDDGRSLFVVGDPMQSIYRFREAEVGLFIRSRDQGVGSLPLTFAQLNRNFRSRSEIVQWVNQRLGPVFPTTEDIAAGAVAYAPSVAGREHGGIVDVMAHSSDAAEAEAIAILLGKELAQQQHNPAYQAAIIVRARSHLRALLPALARHSIPFRAVKLDPLTSTMVVQDLMAITRLITQPVDRSALLALLRSPICGLTLADLHAFAGAGGSPFDGHALERLTPTARTRAEPVLEALQEAQSLWRRRPIRDLVEGVWQRLGGPNCVATPATDLRDANVYLDTLEQAAAAGLLTDWNDFLERLDGEFTEGDPPSPEVKLEVLTMHGAKGLEWDLVVLPALNKRPANTDSPLLHWLPFTGVNGTEQVLLAPLRSAEAAKNPPLVTLIRTEQRKRAAFENQRLLYVATTRARDRLVLSAQLDSSADDPRPGKGSLLADLWPTCAQDFVTALHHAAGSIEAAMPAATGRKPFDQSLRRIEAGWQPPLTERLRWSVSLPVAEPDSDSIEYDWASRQARTTGTVLHQLLERIGTLGIENVSTAQRQRLLARIPLLLKAKGIRVDQLEESTVIISAALQQTLDSSVGQWLLSGAHAQSACELPISGMVHGQLVNAVVDRTFVDAHGVRWIIDYKSGYRAGADLDGFFAQEAQRYREQLNRYRTLFTQFDRRVTKTALFLPRHVHLEPCHDSDTDPRKY